MATLEDDLTHLNFQYLMLFRECARSHPMEAAWRFGVIPEVVDRVADLSLEQIQEQAAINRAVISLLPLCWRRLKIDHLESAVPIEN